MTTEAKTPERVYDGNGVSVSFSAPFRFLTGTLVVDVIAADGSATTLVEGVGYTVSGGGTDAGGVVTLVSGGLAPNGTKIRLRRNTARRQGADYDTNDTFPAETHEGALDRQMMIAQEQDVSRAALESRAVLFPEGERGFTFPSQLERSPGALMIDEAGALVIYPQAPVVAEGYSDYSFDLNDGSTQIAIPLEVMGRPLAVLINGQEIQAGVDYSVSPTLVTLSVAAHAGDVGTLRVAIPATLLRGDAKSISYRATALASAALPGTVEYRLGFTVYLDDEGAVGDHDGVTGSDDNQALIRCIAKLPYGGTIKGRPGGRYFFSNPPALPSGIWLEGTWVQREDRISITSPLVASSAIILPPDKPLRTAAGVRIQGWLFWKLGLSKPTSYADALAKIATFEGTAIINGGDDLHVHHNTFIGFEWAVQSIGYARPEVHHNCSDCTNGIEISGALDCGNVGVSFNRFWPYLVSHQEWSNWPLARRSGVALYLHDTADMLISIGNFSYGYATGALLENLSAVEFSARIDNVGSFSPADADGTVGIETRGDMNNVRISGHVDSQQDNFKFGHTGGLLQIGAITSGSATRYQLVLGPGSSGQIGQMMLRGSCVTPIKAYAVSGTWTAPNNLIDSNASSNLVIEFDPADRAKLRFNLYQPQNALSDTLSGGSVVAPAIRLHPVVASGLFLPDADRLGFGVGAKDVLHMRAEANAVNFAQLGAANTGGRVTLETVGGDASIAAEIRTKGNAPIYVGGDLLPVTDDTRYAGDGTHRFKSIRLVNAPEVTSDPRLKTDMEAIDPQIAMQIVQMIDPVSYRMKVGGNDIEWIDEPVAQQVTITMPDVMESYEVVDGQAVLRRVPTEKQVPVTERVPVVDENGQPVMIRVEAITKAGVVVEPERWVPRMVDVPKMEMVTKSVPRLASVPGGRTHWGFNARQVGAVFEVLERDFGGFIVGEDGFLALRYEQFVAILWAAVRGLMAGSPVPAELDHPDFSIGTDGEAADV